MQIHCKRARSNWLLTITGVNLYCGHPACWLRLAYAVALPSAAKLVSYFRLNPRVHQSGLQPAQHGRINQRSGAPAPADAGGSRMVGRQRAPGPLRAFFLRIRGRRGQPNRSCRNSAQTGDDRLACSPPGRRTLRGPVQRWQPGSVVNLSCVPNACQKGHHLLVSGRLQRQGKYVNAEHARCSAAQRASLHALRRQLATQKQVFATLCPVGKKMASQKGLSISSVV